MKLSEKIVRLRKARGMSQEALAEQLDVSRQAVSRWEVGSALPDASNVLQLSKLFGVSADYLLDDAYEEEWSHSAPDGSARPSVLRVIGVCMSGFGLFGSFVIYVLSRFIEVMVPHVTHENGQTWYTYSSGITARSYRYFIQEYNLEFLTVLFWLLALAGLVMALVPKEKFTRMAVKIRGWLQPRSDEKKEG